MADKNTTKIRKTTIETANKIAKENGYSDAGEFLNKTRARMVSEDLVDADAANRAAGDFTQRLVLLTLKQELQSNQDLEGYDWINKFDISKIDAGNSMQFDELLMTGIANYNENQFIPQGHSNPALNVSTISLYKANTTNSAAATLADWSKKIKKPLTIRREEWMPYFVSGKLQEFITKITGLIQNTIHLFKFTMIQTIIRKLKTGKNSSQTPEGMWNVINNPSGVNNILDVFTKVVYPNIDAMALYSRDYNIGTINPTGTTTQHGSMNKTNRKDLIMLVNRKTYTKLRAGVLSKVFNNKLADIDNYISAENIIPCGYEINVPENTSGVVTTNNNELVAENEIIVINKNAIKGLLFVDASEQQAWAENLTLQLVYHLWIAYGVLPWGQGFVVRTNALTQMPTI